MQSAASRYPLGNSRSPRPLVDTMPYFTRNHFHRHCWRNRISLNSVWLGNARRRMVFTAGSAVLIVLAAGGWHHYYNSNWNAGVGVLEQARTFMDVPLPQGIDYDGNLQLPLLNPVLTPPRPTATGETVAVWLTSVYTRAGASARMWSRPICNCWEQRYLPALTNGLIKDLATAPQNSRAETGCAARAQNAGG